MLKLIVITLFLIIATQPLYGYTITTKEEFIGILNKQTLINDVEYIEIDGGVVYIEIKGQGKVYPYSFLCSQLVYIADDNGLNIPFNCDDSKNGASIQMGQSVIGKEETSNTAQLNQDINSSKISQIQDVIIREGSSRHMNLTKYNIKIEDDVVIIEISCRRTKIKSTLITLYWLCGYALDQHKLFYSEIRVILNIQKKQVETLVTIAKGKDVIKLSQLKSSKYSSFSNFLDKLEVYRKQD